VIKNERVNEKGEGVEREEPELLLVYRKTEREGRRDPKDKRETDRQTEHMNVRERKRNDEKERGRNRDYMI
jgi:hypothetical protein